MITLYDVNQSWQAPEGFNFVGVKPKGSYLIVTFARRYECDAVVRGSLKVVKVYLETQGREVMRTVEEFLDPAVPPKLPDSKPISVRFKFWNGFLIVLQGLQEMSKCRKK